jgi:hypothetical protein
MFSANRCLDAVTPVMGEAKHLIGGNAQVISHSRPVDFIPELLPLCQYLGIAVIEFWSHCYPPFQPHLVRLPLPYSGE